MGSIALNLLVVFFALAFFALVTFVILTFCKLLPKSWQHFTPFFFVAALALLWLAASSLGPIAPRNREGQTMRELRNITQDLKNYQEEHGYFAANMDSATIMKVLETDREWQMNVNRYEPWKANSSGDLSTIGAIQ